MIVKKFISTDFPNATIIVKQFQKMLADNAAINFTSLILRGDELTITLDEPADSPAAIEFINTTIAQFRPDPSYNVVDFKPITIYPTPDNKTFFSQWYELSSFTFAGTLQIGIPSKVTIFASVSTDNPLGSIRLYDATNQVILCTFDVTAKIPEEYTIMPHDCKWPRHPAILEIHAKQSTNDFANYTICSVLVIS
jgi:hypothetical protein